jgi:hypothetical protein
VWTELRDFLGTIEEGTEILTPNGFLVCSVGDPDPDPHFLGLFDPDPLVRSMDPAPDLDPDPSLFL